MTSAIELFIADDHQMFIDGIKALLHDIKYIHIAGEANTGNEVLQKLKNTKVDIILLDIRMPDLNGIETATIISKSYPAIKILALTMYDDSNNITKMLKAGVKGYVLKNTSKDELIRAIQRLAEGNTFYSEQVVMDVMNKSTNEDTAPVLKLTKREIEVIKLIVKSMTNKEIAVQLFLSELTVKTHRQNVMQKLDVRNTAGLVKFAMDNNLTDF